MKLFSNRNIQFCSNRKLRILALHLAFGVQVLSSSIGLAMDSADVLPSGIYSPSIRIGFVTGIGQSFGSEGELQSLGDMHTMTFDAKKLISIQPQVAQLVSALNQFGSQNLGDKINIGYLKFNIQPQVNYYAPVFARGITDRWTLAIGAPIIRYQNSVSLESTGSNVDAIHAQVGFSSAQLNAAFSSLKVNLVNQAQQTIASLGYQPIGQTNRNFVGDIQVASLYQFYKDDHNKLMAKTLFGLPTGAEADPNDLTALDISGQTSIEQQFIYNYRLFAPLTLAAKVFYHYNLADKVNKRVPADANDTLPAQDQSEKVERKIGDAGGAGISATYEVFSRLAFSAGLEFQSKASDRFNGTLANDYEMLAFRTNSTYQLLRLGIAYSTVQTYFKQQSFMPFIASFEYSDVISGINMPRITTNELWLTMFF